MRGHIFDGSLLKHVGFSASKLGLISNWRLDEVSGSALDSFGANTLTDNNTVTSATGNVFPLARQFTAANSEYLSIADNTSVSIGDIDASFEIWFFADSVGVTRRLIGKWDNAVEQEYTIGINFTAGDNFPQFLVSSTGLDSTSLVSATPIVVSTWNQLILRHDSIADTISLQFNNGAIESTAHSGGLFDGAQPFRIGSLGTPGQYWDGRIGPIRMAKRVWTTGEGDWLYNGGAGRAF